MPAPPSPGLPERMRAALITGLGPAEAVPVGEVWPLERAGEALRAAERGQRGRVVLRVAGP